MPATQIRPQLRLDGTLRGEVETFDSRPDADGVVVRRGRATVLTDEGGFIEVSIEPAMLDAVIARGPSPVSWLVEIGAWKKAMYSGKGEDRRPFVNAEGHPVFTAELACRLVRDLAAADAVPASKAKVAA